MENIVTGDTVKIPGTEKNAQTNRDLNITRARAMNNPVQEQPPINFSDSQVPIPEEAVQLQQLGQEQQQQPMPQEQLPPVPIVPRLSPLMGAVNPQDNPSLQPIFTDTSRNRELYWQEKEYALNTEIANRGVQYTDVPLSFPTAPPPLLSRDVGQQLEIQDQQLQNQRDRARGWSALDWEFSNYSNRPSQYNPITPTESTTSQYRPFRSAQPGLVQPTEPYQDFLRTGKLRDYYTNGGFYDAPIPPNEILANLQRNNAPGYLDASFPGAQLPGRAPDAQINSERSIFGGASGVPGANALLNFGRDWWNRSRTQVETLLGVFEDLFGVATGSGASGRRQRQAFDAIIKGDVGNPQNWQNLFPNTLEPLSRGLNNASPVVMEEALTGYAFNPLKGQFGESGTGWLGAATYALSVPENILWAGVYGVADLAQAVNGAAGGNLPIIQNIPDEGEPRGIGFRLAQALSGTDLSLLNLRDNDRYLSLIDEEQTTAQNIGLGALAFGLSFVVGGWSDNAVRAARRGTTWALGQVPDVAKLGSANRLSATQFQELSNVFDDVDNVTTPLSTNTAHHIETLGANPASVDPVPNTVRRTNDELSVLAQTNDLAPPGTVLSNTEIAELQLTDGLYNRWGEPLTDLGVTPTPPMQAVDSVNVARWLDDAAPPELSPNLFDVPNIESSARFQAATTYLNNTDNLIDIRRGMQELEQQIDVARWEVLRQSKPLARGGFLSLRVRGSAPSSVSTRLNLGRTPTIGTAVADLYEAAPLNESQELVRGLYHGTRQVDLTGVDFRMGAAHEYGVGLYLTRDVNYAKVASRASRLPSNPIPGTTRLGNPTVFEVNPQFRRVVSLSESNTEIADIIYESAQEVFNLRRTDITRSSNELRTMWLDVRESYIKRTNSPINELKYREFSTIVADRIVNELGIDALEDTARGVVIALPQTVTGQIPMRPQAVDIAMSGRTQESYYARHKMDVELHQALNHPITEAWERQSRVKYENSLLQDLVSKYSREGKRANQALNQTIDSERRLRKLTRRLDTERMNDISNARRTPPEILDYTPENLDDPCL